MKKLCCLGRNSTESLNDDQGSAIYVCKNHAEIEEGYVFMLHAQLAPQGDRFIIDFGADNCNKDIVLRLAVRASTNSLGRSSRIEGIWSEEEISTASNTFRLTNEREFEIQVFFTRQQIFIALDGIHVAKYGLRVPLFDVSTIEIRGQVTVVHTDHKRLEKYPLRESNSLHISRLRSRYAATADIGDIESESDSEQSKERDDQFLPLPYYAAFNEGFFAPGYSMIIAGHVSANPKTIEVALQMGEHVWPQPNVAVQVEFRFTDKRAAATDEPVVVINSFADVWAGEVKPNLKTGLRPGADFNLVIVRGARAFEIHLNNKNVFNYPYRRNPRHVNTCLVKGDLKLIDVRIESD